MNNQFFTTTERLLIQPLTLADCKFILELVNTEGWIKFIGNRNITSETEAGAYIQKILENKDIFYWAVKLKYNKEPIGIVTYIKRNYLEHHDIGFAFLPNFYGKGYAYEAANAVLHELIHSQKILYILATTLPCNTSSVKLLKKLGLVFEKEIEIEKEKLHVYGVATDELVTNKT